MRLLPFGEQGGGALSTDHADRGYSLHQLEALLQDVDGQPDWRPRADIAHAYYDFKQLSPEKQRKIRVEMGIDPRQTNLIHGVINGVLGQEARARSDVRVEADDDSLIDVTAVLSQAMKELQRESFADMAISEAYAGQVKGGIGWVEVSRSTDPLDYPYRIEARHRNEIWYDWRATDLGLKTARWMLRKRWMDLDEAVALLPQFRKILESCVNGWDVVNLPDDVNNIFYRSYNNERTTTIRRDEFVDSTRKRLKFFEVWYRVPAEVVVMQLSPTRRVLFDENNPLHVAALERGRVRISKAMTRQVRMALFAGPHRLIDVGTTRRNFPYIPFFAFRDDEDRTPYGLIEGMISPQDEYNDRRQMINWMLRARQMLIDNDALDPEYNSIADVADNAGRPDQVIVLNSGRKGQVGVKIGNDLQLQKEQIDVMQDAKQLIQEVPRVYSTQLGDRPAGVTSGIAIQSLTDAGVVAMGELNDNYRFGRRMVYEAALDLVVEDHLEAEMRVLVGSGKSRRVVVLNTFTPEGEPLNQVKDAPVKVGLSDVPNSPAYRMQEQQMLGDIIRSLAAVPQAVAVMAPAFVEGSSHPDAKRLADDLRRATGQPTSGDREAQEAQAQQVQKAQQDAQQLQMRGVAAKVAKDEADAQLTMAKTATEQAKTAQTVAQAESTAVQTQLAVQPPANDEDTLIEAALQEALPAA